ncbi:helix-turn-helix domain-containing protein [Pseudobacteroides cellulosolvens]|uniref:Helix-turn-helix domain protein n=1 Tax=Pseudobacteroides cellulosolvens ATCC 35603 = DSM 2933 TaxID=398512 RepID=A0A0L6JMJ8_9FIRM|nr:helix-turn-helix transcriptional regulator [Pseudobacteroides cellulosolvens]KNY26994.1 helix-turn-helix domain protein [Pseudobacteroides cellulosolvens ATCC 35603 = DSM 2933]
MDFSRMLKQLREEKSLSQKDIAEYLGLTRQAVASYELAKREPDYDVLKKLADYFGVSVDYLLGRVKCKDVNALTVGRNIDLIRGSMTFKEMSESISKKMGTMIFPEMLELYARGERMPFSATLKIIAKYAGVRETFFYTHNTLFTYEKEKELYKREEELNNANHARKDTKGEMGLIDEELRKWIFKDSSIEYLRLAKKIQESGMPPLALEPLINSFKSNKQN